MHFWSQVTVRIVLVFYLIQSDILILSLILSDNAFYQGKLTYILTFISNNAAMRSVKDLFVHYFQPSLNMGTYIYFVCVCVCVCSDDTT